MMESDPADMVTLDIMMPNMDGWVLYVHINRLRERFTDWGRFSEDQRNSRLGYRLEVVR